VGAEARLELWQADRHLAQAELTRQLEAPGADPGPDPTTFGPP
jgi:hypothetical protein